MAATADATAATAKRERAATTDQAAVDAAVEARLRAEADAALVLHDAALPRALAAEQEVPPQKKDWDATANRARLALEPSTGACAKERAAAAAATVDGGGTTGGDDQSLGDALLFHKAVALLNLHAQTVAVQNIRSLMPLGLDLASGTSSCSPWANTLSKATSSPLPPFPISRLGADGLC